jgi:predicted solute-binding protein
VNRYSVDLGLEGRRAIELMFTRADGLALIPKLSAPLFLA